MSSVNQEVIADLTKKNEVLRKTKNQAECWCALMCAVTLFAVILAASAVNQVQYPPARSFTSEKDNAELYGYVTGYHKINKMIEDLPRDSPELGSAEYHKSALQHLISSFCPSGEIRPETTVWLAENFHEAKFLLCLLCETYAEKQQERLERISVCRIVYEAATKGTNKKTFSEEQLTRMTEL